MPSNRNVLAGVAFLVVALISLPVGSAQAPPPRRRGITGAEMPGAGMMNLAGIPGQLDASIPGKPFTATAQVTYGRGQTAAVQLARDADGRTYLKTTLPFPDAGGFRRAAGANPGSGGANAQAEARPSAETMIVIADPMAHRQYVIYPSAKNIEARPLRRMWGMGMRAGGGPALGQAVTTTLGTEPVAGQSAEGLKTVRYVPAHGDQAATTVTREVWRSSSLQLVLKASNTGLARQETSFTLQSLTSGAPEATLFQLPAGYTLQTAPAGRGGRGRRTAGGATRGNFRGGFGGGFRGGRRGPATPPPASSGQ